MSRQNRYILLSSEGFLSDELRVVQPSQRQGGKKRITAEARKQLPNVPGVEDIEIVDSVADNGPKIVEAAPETARSLRNNGRNFVLAPIRKYHPAIRPRVAVRGKDLYSAGSGRTTIKVYVHESKNDLPLSGVLVVAVLDTLSMKGLSRRTGKSGQATFSFPGKSTDVAQLYVYPPAGYWGRYAEKIRLTDEQRIWLEPINMSILDILQHLFPKNARSRAKGKGVRVGVVDSGVDAKHRDLKVVGGFNVTEDGKGNADYGPVSDHGTHVAGIIAGRGEAGIGMVGLAPAVELYSYRVFQEGTRTTDTSYIMKAIYQAVKDKCDFINMSLGGGPADPTLSRAIGYAFENGTVCIAAAGNNRRKDVCYPAWYKRAMAVSALGKKGTFPDTSLDMSEVQTPYSIADGNLFVAGFSNIGYEVDFIGPGVAVVSTVPNNKYAAESGTSMACPAVTGVAAGLLSDSPRILSAERNLKRSLAIQDLLRDATSSLGFTQRFEGLGLPCYPKVKNG